MSATDTTISTTQAATATAADRERGRPAPPGPPAPKAEPGEGTAFHIGDGVTRAVFGRPYERRPEDPLYRPLRIFSLDPSLSQFEGWVETVNVPYEPLRSGFRGAVFEVDAEDGATGKKYAFLDLDDKRVTLATGRTPSPSDPLFHQQMVYAVSSLVYAAFRKALGRDLAWGFGDGNDPERGGRLRLCPYAAEMKNAYYDEEQGELRFGYFRPPGPVYGRNLDKGLVFTSLSHDVVAHELTHALLDGLRSHFLEPTGPDVLAFHEAFADLVAIFQHFSYEHVVRTALARAGGRLEQAGSLTNMARQFGQTLGEKQALRSAIDPDPENPRRYDETLEEHKLGTVLVSAVFHAFVTVFQRKTAQYLRLATGGTGILPAGELPADLQHVLARKASQLAAQFQAICIRAIDYCPPVDIELGEYLRAIVTADRDVVPDDSRWAYREALMDAFRARGIFPRDVDFLSEDALLWRPPTRSLSPIQELAFAELRFAGDPGRPANASELRRQAGALGRLVTMPDCLEVFGLARPGPVPGGQDEVGLPTVQSIRSSRRVGPDGQVVFDLIAEVTQVRLVRPPGARAFPFRGGSTVIIGPDGVVRYVISKSVLTEARLERQRVFMTCRRGRAFWEGNEIARPVRRPFRIVHDPTRGASSTDPQPATAIPA